MQLTSSSSSLQGIVKVNFTLRLLRSSVQHSSNQFDSAFGFHWFFFLKVMSSDRMCSDVGKKMMEACLHQILGDSRTEACSAKLSKRVIPGFCYNI